MEEEGIGKILAILSIVLVIIIIIVLRMLYYTDENIVTNVTEEFEEYNISSEENASDPIAETCIDLTREQGITICDYEYGPLEYGEDICQDKRYEYWIDIIDQEEWCVINANRTAELVQKLW